MEEQARHSSGILERTDRLGLARPHSKSPPSEHRRLSGDRCACRNTGSPETAGKTVAFTAEHQSGDPLIEVASPEEKASQCPAII